MHSSSVELIHGTQSWICERRYVPQGHCHVTARLQSNMSTGGVGATLRSSFPVQVKTTSVCMPQLLPSMCKLRSLDAIGIDQLLGGFRFQGMRSYIKQLIQCRFAPTQKTHPLYREHLHLCYRQLINSTPNNTDCFVSFDVVIPLLHILT